MGQFALYYPMTLTDAWNYHQWAIERTLESCQNLSAEELTRDLGGSFASVRDTLVHTLMADSAWWHRTQGLAYTRPDPANFPDLESIRSAWQPFYQHWAEVLHNTVPETPMPYSAFDGTKYTNTLEEIMRHVVNHGSYHRGQIAMMLRLLGKTPVATDWIAFSRLARA
jgi:uncharacterized damage-inducible protein DinB